jgi:hypothetical protein
MPDVDASAKATIFGVVDAPAARRAVELIANCLGKFTPFLVIEKRAAIHGGRNEIKSA